MSGGAIWLPLPPGDYGYDGRTHPPGVLNIPEIVNCMAQGIPVPVPHGPKRRKSIGAALRKMADELSEKERLECQCECHDDCDW